MAHGRHHGSPIKNVNVAERYIARDAYSCLIITGSDRPTIPKVRNHYAVIQTAGTIYDKSNFSISHFDALKQMGSPDRAEWNKISVLVNVAQAAESPEIVVSSFVWFKAFHHFLDVSRDAEHFPRSASLPDAGSVNGFCVVGEGEIDVPDITEPSATGDGNHHLIKAGAQVIDSFWNEKKQLIRHAPGQFDFCETISGLGVRLYYKAIGITLEEGGNLSLHIVNVVVGPAYLQLWAT